MNDRKKQNGLTTWNVYLSRLQLGTIKIGTVKVPKEKTEDQVLLYAMQRIHKDASKVVKQERTDFD